MKEVFRSMDEVRREFTPRPDPDREPDAYREWELEQAAKRILDEGREGIKPKRLIEEARGKRESTFGQLLELRAACESLLLLNTSLQEKNEQLTAQVNRLRAQVAELREALRIGIRWMQWWLDENECDCEGEHICGRPKREAELQQMKAALRAAGDDGHS